MFTLDIQILNAIKGLAETGFNFFAGHVNVMGMGFATPLLVLLSLNAVGDIAAIRVKKHMEKKKKKEEGRKLTIPINFKVGD